LFQAHSMTLESAPPCSLCSGTHPEGRIGYREGARRNGTLGDIHSTEDRFDHHSASLWPDLVYPT
jgi:hypothetical protein